MKRWFIAAAAGVLALGISAPAYANDPYVGLGVGVFNIDTGAAKKTAFGSYLQVGDDFSQYIGGELRIGTSARNNQHAKVDWFGAAFLKPRYEFNDQLMGYALIGVATVRGSYAAPGGLNQKKTRSGIGYGLGLQYRASENLSLGGEWSHLLSKPKATAATINTSFQGVSTSIFTATVKYHFY